MRRHPAFGTGTFTPIVADDESVLAFLRTTPDETLLCLANMGATARACLVSMPSRTAAA